MGRRCSRSIHSSQARLVARALLCTTHPVSSTSLSHSRVIGCLLSGCQPPLYSASNAASLPAPSAARSGCRLCARRPTTRHLCQRGLTSGGRCVTTPRHPWPRAMHAITHRLRRGVNQPAVCRRASHPSRGSKAMLPSHCTTDSEELCARSGPSAEVLANSLFGVLGEHRVLGLLGALGRGHLESRAPVGGGDTTLDLLSV